MPTTLFTRSFFTESTKFLSHQPWRGVMSSLFLRKNPPAPSTSFVLLFLLGIKRFPACVSLTRRLNYDCSTTESRCQSVSGLVFVSCRRGCTCHPLWRRASPGRGGLRGVLLCRLRGRLLVPVVTVFSQLRRQEHGRPTEPHTNGVGAPRERWGDRFLLLFLLFCVILNIKSRR